VSKIQYNTMEWYTIELFKSNSLGSKVIDPTKSPSSRISKNFFDVYV